MSYRVELSRLAERNLGALPNTIAERIRPRLLALAQDPRPRGSIKIGQPERRRLRIGDYRAFYDVDDGAQHVMVVRVGHRKDVYRWLKGE